MYTPMGVAPSRSRKRLAQEQLEAAAGADTPCAPTSDRAPTFNAGPTPPNTAFKAIVEVECKPSLAS